MAVVNELVSKFSFIGDLAPQREFNENLKLSIALLTGVGTAILAAAGGLFAFVASTTQAADGLLDMNAETGISVESIQELGFAAALSGSSVEAMQSSLNGLSKVAGDAARGLGRGRKAFEDLGISVKDASGNVKTADVIFNELRESFARLGTDRGTQKSIIASLGLDPSTLQLLNATSEEVGVLVEKARALGIVTTEQAQAAADFQDSLDTSKFAVSALSQQIAINLAPATQKITDGFTEFLIANQDLIKDGLQWLGEVIQSTAGFVTRMAPLVLALAGAFVVAQLATGGFATVMGIVLSPVVLITAAIVALLLIVDDLLTALDGGQSVIADFFMEFFGWDIVPVLQGIVNAFKAMFAALLSLAAPFFEAFAQLFNAVIELFKGNWGEALDLLFAAFGTVVEGIKNIFVSLFDFIGTAFGQILGGIKSAAMSILPDWAIDLISSGGSPDSAPGNAGPLPSGSGQDPWDVPGMSPNDAVAMTPAGNTSVNNSQITQNTNIDIKTNDPKAAGAAVTDSLQDQLKTAKTQVNRGGR
jgi:phage-related protein